MTAMNDGMREKGFDELLASLLAGLQRPRSFGLIGAAAPAFDELRIRLGLSGIPSESDLLGALDRAQHMGRYSNRGRDE